MSDRNKPSATPTRQSRQQAALRSRSAKGAGSAKEGASVAKTGAQDKVNSWVDHHKLVAQQSLQKLLQAPVASLMTWLVIAIALALPAALYIFLENAQRLSADWDGGSAHMTLYLNEDLNEGQGIDLTSSLQLRGDIEQAEYISAATALQEFKAMSGFSDVLNYLDDNPLPAVISLRPVLEGVDVSKQADQLRLELEALPEVDQAQLDLQWVQRLYSLMELGQRAVLALVVMLSLAVLLVVSNTIRLAIESRRDEIVVVKLVGGTDAFVRRPFLYTGLWYGFGGGILAWLMIGITQLWLSGPVNTLAVSYGSSFSLNGLGFIGSLVLLLGAMGLGSIGAWVAVHRHLGDIEPT